MRDRQLYGVGYGGMLLKELIEQLVKVGVRVLVDVRLHAMSRKPGFSKCRFVAALEGAGIRYVHDPRAWESERGPSLVSVGRRERGTGGDAYAAAGLPCASSWTWWGRMGCCAWSVIRFVVIGRLFLGWRASWIPGSRRAICPEGCGCQLAEVFVPFTRYVAFLYSGVRS